MWPPRSRIASFWGHRASRKSFLPSGYVDQQNVFTGSTRRSSMLHISWSLLRDSIASLALVVMVSMLSTKDHVLHRGNWWYTHASMAKFMRTIPTTLMLSPSGSPVEEGIASPRAPLTSNLLVICLSADCHGVVMADGIPTCLAMWITGHLGMALKHFSMSSTLPLSCEWSQFTMREFNELLDMVPEMLRRSPWYWGRWF